jgi:hypothetical protein
MTMLREGLITSSKFAKKTLQKHLTSTLGSDIITLPSKLGKEVIL